MAEHDDMACKAPVFDGDPASGGDEYWRGRHYADSIAEMVQSEHHARVAQLELERDQARSERDELRKALEPFADCVRDDGGIHQPSDIAKHFRRASQTLKKTEA